MRVARLTMNERVGSGAPQQNTVLEHKVVVLVMLEAAVYSCLSGPKKRNRKIYRGLAGKSNQKRDKQLR